MAWNVRITDEARKGYGKPLGNNLTGFFKNDKYGDKIFEDVFGEF